METVYLIGPITGDPRDFEWRKLAVQALESQGFRVLSPLRGKKPEQISNQGIGYEGGLASADFARRDYGDISEASIALAYFPYRPERQSVGSFWELGVAHEQGKAIIIVAHDKMILEHLFVRAFADARFSDLNSGVLYIIENYADVPE